MRAWLPLAVDIDAAATAPVTTKQEAPGAPVVPPGGGAASKPASTQEGTQEGQDGNAPKPPAKQDIWSTLGGILPFIVIFVLLYLFLFRGQRKTEKQRQAMIAEMKKGDKVLLISGKFGTVVDIRDDRVVVKVDEANNVKETYIKSAIQRVITEESEGK